jgi:hypothetical protein
VTELPTNPPVAANPNRAEESVARAIMVAILIAPTVAASLGIVYGLVLIVMLYTGPTKYHGVGPMMITFVCFAALYPMLPIYLEVRRRVTRRRPGVPSKSLWVVVLIMALAPYFVFAALGWYSMVVVLLVPTIVALGVASVMICGDRHVTASPSDPSASARPPTA